MSLAYTLSGGSGMAVVRHRISGLAAFGFLLVLTEALFIVGAGAMAFSAGGRVADLRGGRSWPRRIWFIRTHARSFADQVLATKLFGLGFWLNFAGAVGTTTVLIVGAVLFLPTAGWWVLLLLIVDLVGTLSWRIAVALRRRRASRSRAIRVRGATADDIEHYLALQAGRWEEPSRATRAQLESRFRAYPAGMMVGESRGRVIGMAFAMKIPAYDYADPPSWNALTNNGLCDNHDPSGTILYGVDLSTAPGRGVLAGEKLLVAIAQLGITENVKCCMLGGRMPDYHRHEDTIAPDEYLMRRDARGRYLDRQVNYYSTIAGLKIVQLLPDYFDDPDSCDYGVLLRWRNPFHGWMLPRLWSRAFPLLFGLDAALSARRRRMRVAAVGPVKADPTLARVRHPRQEMEMRALRRLSIVVGCFATFIAMTASARATTIKISRCVTQTSLFDNSLHLGPDGKLTAVVKDKYVTIVRTESVDMHGLSTSVTATATINKPYRRKIKLLPSSEIHILGGGGASDFTRVRLTRVSPSRMRVTRPLHGEGVAVLARTRRNSCR